MERRSAFEVTAARRCDVIVVGAGIAGLTAAIALDREGISVQIIERATALTQAGTALSIWPNALAALSQIGLADSIADIGYEEPTAIIREWSGRELVKVDQSRLYRHLGRSTLIVHRGDLQRLLLDACSHIPVRMRSPVEHVATDDGGGVVELAHAETLRASVVLACDGIHSVARTVTDNPLPTYTGRTSWRAVLDDVPELVPQACLSVGQGKQFIASPMRGGSTYWAADVAMPEGANDALTDRRGFLLDSFAGWHQPVTELIQHTQEEQLVTADVYDGVPRVLTAGRVALLGDAAHPMNPDLGQGACQGIEDAVVVAACLAHEPNVEVALSTYQIARLRRVQNMVRESRRLGVLATTESKVVSAFRNGVAVHMPAWLNSRIVARYASEGAFLKTLPFVPPACPI